MSLHYLPPVKPSAIALGTIFTNVAAVAVMAPLFGDNYKKAKNETPREYLESKEAQTAAALWGSSLVGSGVQTYATAALINATGTMSYKGAAYLGSIILMASSAPSFFTAIFQEKRPLDLVAIGLFARVFETVGLSMFLTWWGTRTSPF